MPRIVAIGEALVEVMRVERDQPLDQPALFSGPYPSGAPAILASAAARLGAAVGFIGSVGRDAFGDCIRNRLLADGIDCSALAEWDDYLTGIAFVAYASDGSRSFVFHMAQAAAGRVTMEQIPSGYLDDVAFLHIMGSSLSGSVEMRETCYEAARIVCANGGQVSLDPNLRPELLPLAQIRAVCQPILALCSVVLPSGEELLTLTGQETVSDGVACLLDDGVEIVALKQGDQGSTLYTRDTAIRTPAYSVDEVDPTGAGDCFDAAVLVGLSEGWPLAQCALFANAAGALATTRLGPMEGAFPRADVLRFMAEQGRPHNLFA